MSNHINGFKSHMSMVGCVFIEEKKALRCCVPASRLAWLHALTRLIADLWTWCVFLISNMALTFLIQSEICGLLLHNSTPVFSVCGTVFSHCKCLQITEVSDTMHSRLLRVISVIMERKKISFFPNCQNIAGETAVIISRIVQDNFSKLFFCACPLYSMGNNTTCRFHSLVWPNFTLHLLIKVLQYFFWKLILHF